MGRCVESCTTPCTLPKTVACAGRQAAAASAAKTTIHRIKADLPDRMKADRMKAASAEKALEEIVCLLQSRDKTRRSHARKTTPRARIPMRIDCRAEIGTEKLDQVCLRRSAPGVCAHRCGEDYFAATIPGEQSRHGNPRAGWACCQRRSRRCKHCGESRILRASGGNVNRRRFF